MHVGAAKASWLGHYNYYFRSQENSIELDYCQKDNTRKFYISCKLEKKTRLLSATYKGDYIVLFVLLLKNVEQRRSASL